MAKLVQTTELSALQRVFRARDARLIQLLREMPDYDWTAQDDATVADGASESPKTRRSISLRTTEGRQ